MGLQEDILSKVKEEISNDPFSVGYLGKTDDEIQQLLNSPVERTKIVTYYDTAPMSRILNKIKDAPNIISSKEVGDAKAIP